MKFLWRITNNYKQDCMTSEDEASIDKMLVILRDNETDKDIKVRYRKERIPVLEATDYDQIMKEGVTTIIFEYSRLNNFKDGPTISRTSMKADPVLFRFGRWQDYAEPSIKLRLSSTGFSAYARMIKSESVDSVARELWKRHPANQIMAGFYLKWFAEADFALDLDFEKFFYDNIDEKSLDAIDPYLWRFE